MLYLLLLPCLALTDLALMKEIIYLHFLFSAIDQNHSSLLLHAQLAGWGLFLHWAGHSAAEMLTKKIPFWLWWTRVKAASAVATAVLSRVMSWNLLSPLCPCFHSGEFMFKVGSDQTSAHCVLAGVQSTLHCSPAGLQSLWNSLWWGCQG